jgi:hypothetical protein
MTFIFLIYNIKENIIMKKLKKEEDRRKRISITLSPEINELLKDNTTNKSRYIETSLLNYFNKCGLDTKNIKL